MKLSSQLKWFVPPLIFVLLAMLFFSPVIKGKQIIQSDILQYIGMSAQHRDFKKKTDTETYWTDGAFSGMPTYQIGAQYPYDFIKKLDHTLRFLPRPADYLFLYFIGFYILMLVLRVDYRVATIGALCFGLSTYLIIILDVGHNSKAHAIGYFPLVIAGILLVFRKRFLLGFILSTLAIALEINANHYQMTYYLMILILVFGIVEGLTHLRKSLRLFLKKISILLGAFILAFMFNATALMATYQYVQWSTRGDSELNITPKGTPKVNKSGLDKDYITQYSYGIFESFNLLVPRLLGGSNGEHLGEDSNTYRELISKNIPREQALSFSSNAPTYWGDQPIVAGPAYLGIVCVFLFFLSLFILKGPTKKWLLTGIIVSLLLSWGKNFGFLTNLMIDYFPLYDKFRAVSSIQVLLELCIPILIALGLHHFFFNKRIEPFEKIKFIKQAGIITLGILVFLFLIKGTLSFRSVQDYSYEQYFGEDLMRIIISDRKAIYNSDLIRALLLAILSILALFGYAKKKITLSKTFVIITLLIVFDLWTVGKRYIKDDDFSSDKNLLSFHPNKIDLEIMKDTTNYRVWNTDESDNGARTSYFHRSIGGYHAAKPQRMENIFSYLLSKNSLKVLNLLNVKYIIQGDEVQENKKANGNAWFVEKLIPVSNSDKELMALDSLNSKRFAVINQNRMKEGMKTNFLKDSTSNIALSKYSPNKLIYQSENLNDGLIVFSEAHYPKGWTVSIDGEPADLIRVDYLLRGVYVPKGKHTIRMSFSPKIIKTGKQITLSATFIFIILLLVFIPKEYKIYKKENSTS